MNKTVAIIIVVLVLLAVMYAARADHTLDHAPDPDFSVEFHYNENDGLVYFWCKFGCDEFITYAPFNQLSQGFADTIDAANQITIWQNRKYGTNYPLLSK